MFASTFGVCWISLTNIKGVEILDICYGLSFLKVYGNETTHASIVLTTPKTFQKWAWNVVEELSELSVLKVRSCFLIKNNHSFLFQLHDYGSIN
jgi:hypothetical protein